MVTHLKENVPETFFVGVREAYRDDPDEWWAQNGWHFSQGMQIRNLLREVATDEEIGENMDDVYVDAIEVAAGVRSG